MNKDVIQDRYARLFELPQCLHSHVPTTGFCLDYRLQPSPAVPQDLAGHWRRTNLPRTLFLGWLFSLFASARAHRPSCVIASSDCLCVVVGAALAKLLGARFHADLYDDYSTFGMARIPGMKALYRRALASADGLSAVSSTLGLHLQEQFPGKPVQVLESTIDATRFQPNDKQAARALLGLDTGSERQLVGICGGLNAYHGADVVFQAMRDLQRSAPAVQFVVAGKVDEALPLPEQDNVTYLGMLPHDQMPAFFSAMDAQVVALADNRFGYFAFPQKAYEVLACRVPVVAADVGALGKLFNDLPEARYQPDSPQDLARAILGQLQARTLNEVPIPDWADQSQLLATAIAGY